MVKKGVNIPNILTVIRLILGPFIFVSIFLYQPYITVLLFLIGVTTDFLDGYIARKYKLITKFGKNIIA